MLSTSAVARTRGLSQLLRFKVWRANSNCCSCLGSEGPSARSSHATLSKVIPITHRSLDNVQAGSGLVGES